MGSNPGSWRHGLHESAATEDEAEKQQDDDNHDDGVEHDCLLSLVCSLSKMQAVVDCAAALSSRRISGAWLRVAGRADVAQLVEQALRKRHVAGSSPAIGSISLLAWEWESCCARCAVG